ncbi:MAG: cysteine desulfurase-like protein [Geodermatophilaceae bacterium]|nr:cysteine desulfurase-like protein [Geodermatophilaceae bacterium]
MLARVRRVALDIARVRGLFPSLSDGFVHLDGPAGSLVPESVALAVGATMQLPIGNTGGAFPSSVRAGELRDAARGAMADLIGGTPGGVVLGPSMTTLTYVLSRALAKTWRAGDEVIVSRLDHDANVRPWLQAAAAVGARVRWAEIDIDTCELGAEQYDELLNERTRLVAVTAASNAVGTRPDVRAIADRAHAVGALVYVDAVHAAPHIPLDMAALGADFIAVSAYKWCGPHVAAVVAAPAVLEGLHPDKLIPSPDTVPDRFETGTPPFELFAGVVAAVEHVASLDSDPVAGRRERVLASMTAVEAYEGQLMTRLDQGLRAMQHVTLLGAPARRTPTVSLTVEGMSPRQVTEELARRGICAWDGDYYARELIDALGVSESGGAVRLGLAHYTAADEIEHTLGVFERIRS